MHQNSLNIMEGFVKQYLDRNRVLKILDLGSAVVDNQRWGSYRKFFDSPKWEYIGADIEAGKNVDVIVSPYKFPFKDEEFDVIISGQTLEHMEFPWLWIKELARILKKGGISCLIAPAVIHEHKYPIDTYRYYPDGMKALAKWAELEPLKVERVVASLKLEDTYIICQKKQ
jgi:SAM-dependent methyltransferase